MSPIEGDGAALLGRDLEVEQIGGIPHYVLGQHDAAIVDTSGEIVGLLSFVNAFGVACLVACSREGDVWEARYSRQAGYAVTWPLKRWRPGTFTFSEKMLATLDLALRDHLAK